MPEFVHSHKRGNASEVRKLVQKALDEMGYSDYVEWEGNKFSACAGLGTMLDFEGRITDDDFIVEKAGGAFGDKVLEECKIIAERI